VVDLQSFRNRNVESFSCVKHTHFSDNEVSKVDRDVFQTDSLTVFCRNCNGFNQESGKERLVLFTKGADTVAWRMSFPCLMFATSTDVGGISNASC